RCTIIAVKALLALTAEQAAGNTYRHLRRGLVHRLVKILFKDAHHHCMGNVAAHEVEQFEWTHPKTCRLFHQQIVSARGCGCLGYDAQCLWPISAARVIDDKAGGVGRNDGMLVEPFDETD